MPDAIIVVDSRRRILLVNAETERMFGYVRQEVIGQPVERLLPGESWRALGARDRRDPRPSFGGGGPGPSARHRDGRDFPVEIRVGVVGTPDGPVTIGGIRDAGLVRGSVPALPAGRVEPTASPAGPLPPEGWLVEASHDLRNSLGVLANAVHYLGVVLPDDEHYRKHLGLMRRELAAATRVVAGLLGPADQGTQDM